jgi:hypothetical protein
MKNITKVSFGDMTVRFRGPSNHPSREYREHIDSLGPFNVERFQITVVHQ